MRQAHFTEHQILAVIKAVEAGRTVKDVCCKADGSVRVTLAKCQLGLPCA